MKTPSETSTPELEKPFFPDLVRSGDTERLTPGSGMRPIQQESRENITSILTAQEEKILLDHIELVEDRVAKTIKDCVQRPAQALYTLHFVMQDLAKLDLIFHRNFNPNNIQANTSLQKRVEGVCTKLETIFDFFKGKEIATYDSYGNKRIERIYRLEIFHGSTIDVLFANGHSRRSLFDLIQATEPKHLVRPVDRNSASVTGYVSSTLDIPVGSIELTNEFKDGTYVFKINLDSGSILLKLKWINSQVLGAPGKRTDYMQIEFVSNLSTHLEDPRLKQFTGKYFVRNEGKVLLDTLRTPLAEYQAPKKQSFWESAKTTVKGLWKKLGF